MTAATSGRFSSRGILLVVVLVLLLVGVVVASGSGAGRPYDLDDAGDQGYKALRLILERLGGQVDRVGAARVQPSLVGQAPIAFVPVADGASRQVVDRWRAYVAAGGTLVVGTPMPTTRLRNASGPDSGLFGIVARPPGSCDITGLAGLGSIDPADAAPLRVPLGARSCYGDGDLALVVEQAIGSGRLVTLASPDLFTNEAMRPHDQEVDVTHEPMRDNVVVAQRLLDPAGSTRVAVVTSGIAAAPSTGHTRQVTDFLSPGVKAGIWELLAAAVLYAWWRSRRHGRVVVESQPVPVAGSELVAAVGNLMSRRRDPARAAAIVRADTARVLGERLGVPRDTDPRLLATMIAQRIARDDHVVAAALFASPVQTDVDLIAVTSQLESIRQEMLHGRRPPAATAVPTPAAAGTADLD